MQLVDEVRTELYTQRLRLLGLPSLYYRRQRGDMITIFQMYMRDSISILQCSSRQQRPESQEDIPGR